MNDMSLHPYPKGVPTGWQLSIWPCSFQAFPWQCQAWPCSWHWPLLWPPLWSLIFGLRLCKLLFLSASSTASAVGAGALGGAGGALGGSPLTSGARSAFGASTGAGRAGNGALKLQALFSHPSLIPESACEGFFVKKQPLY